MNSNYLGEDLEYYYRQNLHTGIFDFEKFTVAIHTDDIRGIRQSDMVNFIQDYEKRIDYFITANDLRVAGFLKKKKE